MEEIEVLDGLEEISDGKQYVVVKIANEQYGIDIGIVDNIVRMQRITRVPKSQEYYVGVINLRGDVVPVMSMRTKLGMESVEFDNSTRIIIAKFDTNAYVGFIVDEVMQIVTLNDSKLERPSFRKNGESEEYIVGVGKHEDMLISVLDMNAIVDEGTVV